MSTTASDIARTDPSRDDARRTRLGGARSPASSATAAALGVSELLAGILPGATSLVAAVGQVVIDLQPPGAKDVVVACSARTTSSPSSSSSSSSRCCVGAVLGLVARRRYEIAAGVFIAFGVVGFLAALGDPLANPAVAAAATAISIGVGTAGSSAGCWTGHGRPRSASSGADATARRDAGLVAPLVHDPGGRGRRRCRRARRRRAQPARAPADRAGRQRPGHPAGVGDRAGASARTRTSRPTVAGLTPIVMPNDRFYRIDTSLLTPSVDTATWTLRIHGLVDRETTLTWDAAHRAARCSSST